MEYSKNRILNLIFSLSISLFIITSIIKFTVNFKQLYYFSIDYLNIPKLSNMTKEDIKLNYDYLIDYNTSNSDLDFKLPTLESSVQGKIHFEEVRDIFQNVKKLNNITLIFLISGIYISIKNKDLRILKYSSVTLILIPIVLIMPMIINFQKSFEVFHNILFKNDYWIFDPNLDSVINILPAEFFFHSAIMILILIFTISLLMIFSYKKLSKRSSD
ncbi:TIGR01906 family membrane protein [Paraclostridium tenue]|uniref:TIGR01906 family membrane protein n=1 Tax=Paraclostridium tenue TaxID=1737 RepID=A0ABP3XCQ7_9FIRM